MELFLGAALVAFLLAKVVTNYRVEHEYAKQGAVPPRIQAKLDRIAAGSGEKTPARPGASGYLRELWHDAWDDMTDRHRRVRSQKRAGQRPTVPQRVAGWWRWALTPVGDPRRPAENPAPVTPKRPPSDMQSTDEPPAPSATPPAAVPPAAPGQPTDPLNLRPRIDNPEPTDPPATGGDIMTQPTATPTPTATPSGEATGVISGVAQAQQLHLAVIALQERMAAEIAALLRATETLAASAAQLEMPAPVTQPIDQAQEALAALSAAVTGAAEEVGAAMKAVETEWAKHLPVVEQSAALGGLANKNAYAGE